jgi:hypothetical protein
MQSFSLLRHAGFLFLAFWPLPPMVFAQQALRNAVLVDQSVEARQTAATRPVQATDGFKAGPVSLIAGVSYGLELTDNVTLVETSPESDASHRVGLDVRGLWPITESTQLAMGVGLGYIKYHKNDQLDRFDLSPDTELALDIAAKDFVFTFFERATYSQEVVNDAAVSGVAEYPRFDNTIGGRVTWLPGDWLCAVGYSHANFLSSSSDFDDQSRSSEQFLGRAAYRFHPITQAGFEVSGEITDYTKTNRESTTLSLGPYVDWQITDAFRVTARGGYVYYAFSVTSTATNVDDQVSSYYMGLVFDHRLTHFITQGLTVTHGIRPGVNQGSDYVQGTETAYQISWACTRNTTLATRFSYNFGTESAQLSGTEENYDQFSFGAVFGWQMTRKFSSGLTYDYVVRDSDQAGRGYSENRVGMSIRYQF